MTWEYGGAIDGNVALLGELQATQSTLALAFSNTIEGARTKARSSLSEGYHSIRPRFIAGWQQWGESLAIPDAPPDVRREAYLSAVVLKVHQDRTYPGSIVASLSMPWGNSSDTIGGYHLVWPRDCVEITGFKTRPKSPTPCSRSKRRWALPIIVITREDDRLVNMR